MRLGKPKKKRKLSEWNKFIRDNSHLAKFKLSSGSPDLKAMSRAFKGGTKSKSKPRAKAKSTGSVKATTKAKPKAKPARRKGKPERKRLDFKKEFDDIVRGLGIPLSKTSFKFIAGTWRLRVTGLGKTVKRIKLGDAMKIIKTRARKRL